MKVLQNQVIKNQVIRMNWRTYRKLLGKGGTNQDPPV